MPPMLAHVIEAVDTGNPTMPTRAPIVLPGSPQKSLQLLAQRTGLKPFIGRTLTAPKSGKTVNITSSGARAAMQSIARAAVASLPSTRPRTISGATSKDFNAISAGKGVAPAISPNALAYIQLRPFTVSAINTIISIVPAVGQLDPRQLAMLTSPGEAMGMLLRADAGDWSDPSAWFDDGSGDTTFTKDAPATPASSADPSMPDFGPSYDPNYSPGFGETSVPYQSSDPSAPGYVDPSQWTDSTTQNPATVDPSFTQPGTGGDLLGSLLQTGAESDPTASPDVPPPGDVGPSVPVSSSGGSTTGATMDRAVILQSQTDLATWRAAFPNSSALADYGATTADLTGVEDSRFISQLQSYQRWANANKGEALRVDGDLDQASYDSLSRTTAAIIQGMRPNATANAAAAGGLGTALLIGGLALGAWMFLK